MGSNETCKNKWNILFCNLTKTSTVIVHCTSYCNIIYFFITSLNFYFTYNVPSLIFIITPVILETEPFWIHIMWVSFLAATNLENTLPKCTFLKKKLLCSGHNICLWVVMKCVEINEISFFEILWKRWLLLCTIRAIVK